MANENYINAKKQKNDEFYTLYEYIQKEVNAYLEYNPDTFRDKTILLPCDDPEWSNFTKFFAQNFELLGLKKLISTSYALDSKKEKYQQYRQLSLFENDSPDFDEDKSHTKGKIYTLSKDNDLSGHIDFEDLEWEYLEGDGSFLSDEVAKLRDEADVIITNPPFSLFKEFIDWVFEADKKCLVIGNIGMATYREVFKLIKENKLWVGATNNGQDMVFEVPEGAIVAEADRKKAERMGYCGNFTRQGNSCWFTNLDHGRRHQPLELMTMDDNLRYSKFKEIKENGYVTYDNYDAIEVKYAAAIPSDYDGVMGVASSFLQKYCPEQFEIVACSQTGCHPDEMVLKEYKNYKGYKQSGKPTGRTGSTCGHNPMIVKNDGVHDYYMNEDGVIVQSTNGRIFIKKRDKK